MVISVDQAVARMPDLRGRHAGRRSKMDAMLALSRNIDPRQTTDFTKVWERFTRNFDANSNQDMLETNEPKTYLDLAIHMLSGRPLGWILPRIADPEPADSLASGKAERLVRSIFDTNDAELAQAGEQRLLRATMDSAARFGMAAIYRQAFTQDNETIFLIQPWDPRQVSERTDRKGMKELVRDYTLTAQEIVDIGPDGGWDVSGVRPFANSTPGQVFQIADYWIRETGAGKKVQIENVVTAFPGDLDGTNARLVLKAPTIEENESSIPIEVQLYNGESFGEGEWKTQSLLEPNFWTYLAESDLMRDIDKHIDQTLARVMQEGTHGGRPKADPVKILAPRGTQSVTTYDTSRGETGLRIVEMNPLDRAISIRATQLAENRQKGSAPSMLHGTLNFTLSGFAIEQLLGAALATVAEAQVVSQLLFGRLGKWVLEEFKRGGHPRQVITALPGVQRKGYKVEEITPDEIGDMIAIRADINLARPSDLLERVNTARQANPDRRAILSGDTVLEVLFSEEVPDPAREKDMIFWENVEQLPEVQLERAIIAMEKQADRLEATKPEEAGVLRRSAQRMAQRISGGGGTGTGNVNPSPNVTGAPDTRNLSTPAAGTTVNGAGGA